MYMYWTVFFSLTFFHFFLWYEKVTPSATSAKNCRFCKCIHMRCSHMCRRKSSLTPHRCEQQKNPKAHKHLRWGRGVVVASRESTLHTIQMKQMECTRINSGDESRNEYTENFGMKSILYMREEECASNWRWLFFALIRFFFVLLASMIYIWGCV